MGGGWARLAVSAVIRRVWEGEGDGGEERWVHRHTGLDPLPKTPPE